MKAAGQGVKPRRRFVRTTDSNHDLPVFPNLYRNIIPAKPDTVWVGDIMYIRIATGFCYLAAILDACSRKVVGYAISDRSTRSSLSPRCAAPRPAVDRRATAVFITPTAAANSGSTGRRNTALPCRA
jgi:putative transposase